MGLHGAKTVSEPSFTAVTLSRWRRLKDEVKVRGKPCRDIKIVIERNVL